MGRLLVPHCSKETGSRSLFGKAGSACLGSSILGATFMVDEAGEQSAVSLGALA